MEVLLLLQIDLKIKNYKIYIFNFLLDIKAKFDKKFL